MSLILEGCQWGGKIKIYSSLIFILNFPCHKGKRKSSYFVLIRDAQNLWEKWAQYICFYCCEMGPYNGLEFIGL